MTRAVPQFNGDLCESRCLLKKRWLGWLRCLDDVRPYAAKTSAKLLKCFRIGFGICLLDAGQHSSIKILVRVGPPALWQGPEARAAGPYHAAAGKAAERALRAELQRRSGPEAEFLFPVRVFMFSRTLFESFHILKFTSTASASN